MRARIEFVDLGMDDAVQSEDERRTDWCASKTLDSVWPAVDDFSRPNQRSTSCEGIQRTRCGFNESASRHRNNCQETCNAEVSAASSRASDGVIPMVFADSVFKKIKDYALHSAPSATPVTNCGWYNVKLLANI